MKRAHVSCRLTTASTCQSVPSRALQQQQGPRRSGLQIMPNVGETEQRMNGIGLLFISMLLMGTPGRTVPDRTAAFLSPAWAVRDKQRPFCNFV